MLNQNKERLIILDSLRGLAALIVCFHHIFKFNSIAFKGFFSKNFYFTMSFISNLNVEAVLFFFVLSGFCIGLSLKGSDLSIRENINQYFYRRFKRILPIYWIALIFTWFMGLATMQLQYPDYSWLNLFGNLLFIQTSKEASHYWFSPFGLNGPLWTLAYEMFFYVFFPLIYSINKKYLSALSITTKFGILLLFSILCMAFDKIIFIPYCAFFTLFIIWLLGYLISQTFLFNKTYNTLFLISGALFLLYLQVGYFIHSDTTGLIIKGAFIASIFYFIVKFCKKEYGKLLPIASYPINKIFYFPGKGSYVLYALHYPFLSALNYFTIPITIQIILLFLFFVFLCTKLEEWVVRQPFSFFKIDYLRNFSWFCSAE